MPLCWVKALIDVDLIPNLFWGILIVILLIPGHRLRREKGHLRAGQTKVQILVLLKVGKPLPVPEVQLPHLRSLVCVRKWGQMPQGPAEQFLLHP